MKCRVCLHESTEAFRHMLLKKYEVTYYQCASCGFLHTEEPYWLNEAYLNPIASADTGIMQRNLYLSRVTSALLLRLFSGRGKFLDAAGGYGILTRLMRDLGFDYYWHDLYTKNLLARGFERSAELENFEAVSAFEVLEHIQNPLEFISEIISTNRTKAVITSTDLFSGPTPPAPEKWWYYMFDTGQHISFYQHSTLQFIAHRLGLTLYSYKNIHLLTALRLSQLEFKFLVHPRFSAIFSLAPRLLLKSRVWSDHNQILTLNQ